MLWHKCPSTDGKTNEEDARDSKAASYANVDDENVPVPTT